MPSRVSTIRQPKCRLLETFGFWLKITRTSCQRRFALRQPRPRQGGAVATGPRFRKTEIQGPVALEVRIQNEVEQPALSAHGDLRQTGERRPEFAVGLDHAHASRPLGHQEASLRQERQRPRVFQVPGQDLGGL